MRDALSRNRIRRTQYCRRVQQAERRQARSMVSVKETSAATSSQPDAAQSRREYVGQLGLVVVEQQLFIAANRQRCDEVLAVLAQPPGNRGASSELAALLVVGSAIPAHADETQAVASRIERSAGSR